MINNPLMHDVLILACMLRQTWSVGEWIDFHYWRLKRKKSQGSFHFYSYTKKERKSMFHQSIMCVCVGVCRVGFFNSVLFCFVQNLSVGVSLSHTHIEYIRFFFLCESLFIFWLTWHDLMDAGQTIMVTIEQTR
mgnify:CR=1 FL=1